MADEGEAADELPHISAPGDTDIHADKKWVIKEVMPEVGHGLLGGQTGIGKSFILVDIAVRVATEQPFLNRKIKRRSGTFIIAAEGGDEEMRKRVHAAALAVGKNSTELPIRWCTDAPPLRRPGALDMWIAMAEKARDQLQQAHDVDLGLIGVDTLSAAAGFEKSGDENDASVTQKVMNQLRGLGQALGCFTLAVDHYGKSEIGGVRGSSAKTASADLVLAALGDKSKSGTISNVRLAITKNRGGPAGQQYPFLLHKKELGTDADNDPITSLTVEWLEQSALGDGEDVQAPVDPWAASRQSSKRTDVLRLKAVLYELLADQAIKAPVSEGGAVVRMVPHRAVQAAFFARTPAEGSPRQVSQARSKCFSRARDWAEEHQLIGIGEIEGKTHLWLSHSVEE